MQNKKDIISALSILCIMACLQGCVREANYRGVPGPTWQHLSAEQKQLVIDRAYQDEMNKLE